MTYGQLRIAAALAIAAAILWSCGFLGQNPIKAREATRIEREVRSRLTVGMTADEALSALRESGFTPILMPEHKALAGRRELPGEFLMGMHYERTVIVSIQIDNAGKVTEVQSRLEVSGL